MSSVMDMLCMSGFLGCACSARIHLPLLVFILAVFSKYFAVHSCQFLFTIIRIFQHNVHSTPSDNTRCHSIETNHISTHYNIRSTEYRHKNKWISKISFSDEINIGMMPLIYLII
eukprot:83632_1